MEVPVVETELTLKALAYAKEYCKDKIDECGKSVLERLLFIAERMDDEVTTCAALLQDIKSDSMIGVCNILSEFPRVISDTVSVVHYDEYLYFDYLDDPYDVFIRGVMSDESAEKVVLEDLRYRIDLNNYAQLTMELLHKIQMYKDAFMRINNHLSDTKHKINNAVKTDDHFYHEIISYLMDHEKEKVYYDSLRPGIDTPCHNPFDIIDQLSGESFENVMNGIIKALKESPYLSENRLHQYMIVESLSHKGSYPGTADIFRFLFDLSLKQVMSWPAYGILYDHFGEIMTNALEAHVPCDLSDRNKVNEIYKTVYTLLSDFILSNLTPELLHIYSGDEDDEDINDSHAKIEDGNVYEDYLFVECCVSHLEKADFKRHRDVGYIAAFGSEDLNTESTLIENMITYINKANSKEAVTYQIIDSKHYASCKEMFDAIGTKSFGYTKRDAAQIAQVANFLRRFIDDPSMGMLALKVRKLPYPIRETKDIIK